MTTYFTTPSLYDPTDFLPWNYNDYYSIDLSLLTDIELDDPGLGIGDETGNEFPMEPFPFRNIPDYLSSIPEPHQQRVPTPVPSPLTPPPEPCSPHDTPISFQNTPAVSSPPLQSPHSQITEFKQEPSQDEGKENLSCSVGSSPLYETKVEGPMDFKDSGVACHQDDNEDEEQGESTDGKTGKKNEDSPETKKEEEVSKSDEELPRNDRPTRGCPSRYSFRDRGNNPLHRQSRPTVRKTVVLWKFIKELLDKNDSCVSWISREERTFKFVDSKQAAKLWGQRKNKRNMTYEKMSRALRYYYDRQIMYHEEGQKLMYRFGDGAREGREERVPTEESREEFVADAS